MQPIRRPLLRVEQLEERDCPTTLAMYLSGSTLTVFGMPTANSQFNGVTGGLQVTQTGTNQFNIKNNGQGLGTYTAANVSLNLLNHFGSSININLGNQTAPGNIAVNLGLGSGDPTANIADGLALYNGTLGGSFNVRGGGGTENVILNYQIDTSNKANQVDAQVNPLNILGNVTFNAKVNPNSAGDLLDTGVLQLGTPNATAAIDIGGDVITNAVNGIGINTNVTIGGNLLVNGGGDSLNNNTGVAGLVILGRVGGNVTVNGSPGSQNGDRIFLAAALGGPAASIGGNFTAYLGSGNNQVLLAGTIGGNATVFEGNGNDQFLTAAGSTPFQVNGNLSIILGNGNNVFLDTNTGNPGVAADFTVNGNFSISAGNGNNNLGTVASTEIGDLDATLGNGANAPTTVVGPVSGNFNWRAGNGGDSLTIDNPTPATSESFNVNLQFGSGTNALTLGDANALTGTITVSGVANGDNGTNTYAQNANVFIGSPWTLLGF